MQPPFPVTLVVPQQLHQQPSCLSFIVTGCVHWRTDGKKKRQTKDYYYYHIFLLPVLTRPFDRCKCLCARPLFLSQPTVPSSRSLPDCFSFTRIYPRILSPFVSFIETFYVSSNASFHSIVRVGPCSVLLPNRCTTSFFPACLITKISNSSMHHIVYVPSLCLLAMLAWHGMEQLMAWQWCML